MPNRTYSEEEMAALLERAAKLQAKAARNADNRPGLTLAELETIAEEAGIDPIHLQQAATELYDADVSIGHSKASTNATHNYVDQWVVGELTEESWEEVVTELRHRYDSSMGQMMGGGELYGKGKVTELGKSKEWSHMSMSGIETRVIVKPRGESLQIKLSQRVGWGSTMAESITYATAATLLIALIVSKTADSALYGFLTMGAGMLALTPLIAYFDKRWRKKKHAEIEALGNRLAGILSRHAPAPKAHMSYDDDEASRIDASLLDQEDVFEENNKNERSRRREE